MRGMMDMVDVHDILSIHRIIRALYCEGKTEAVTVVTCSE